LRSLTAMARLSLRDRFFTPPVARALTSASGILALGAGAGLGILAGGAVVGAAVVGAVGYALRVALAIPKAPEDARIDPFTLSEPWRHYVRDAMQAHNRLQQAVRDARPGPTRDRLGEIGDRVGTGVREVWRIARRGHDLVDAWRRLDPAGIRHELEQAERHAGDGPAAEGMRDALRSQMATVERLERVIADADSRLRLLNARLDEAAARTIELSVQAERVSDLGVLGDDIDLMVGDMEALRQALDETGGGPAVAGEA
jgi:hypothetical protein